MAGPHHRGKYPQQARQIRATAYANPNTRCAKCGLTHAEAVQQYGPQRAAWTAGHILAGQTGGQLRPEHLTCNASDGARHGNANRHGNALGL